MCSSERSLGVIGGSLRLMSFLMVIIGFSGGVMAEGDEVKEDWSSYVERFTTYFEENRPHFEEIVAILSVQHLYDLRARKVDMVVKWTKHSEWVEAPDSFNTELLPHFTKLKLLNVQSNPGQVVFRPLASADIYGTAEILPVFYYSTHAEGVEYCTEELLASREHGWCWLPLGETDWYVDMEWMHKRH